MENGGDIREHIRKLIDAVDKLGEMEVDIHLDLLFIMLLLMVQHLEVGEGAHVPSWRVSRIAPYQTY